MLSVIKKKFETFPDAVILGFHFNLDLNEDTKNVEILIRCMNFEDNKKWEIIKLKFREILSYRSILDSDFDLIIDTALLIQEKDYIVFDFFPFFTGPAYYSVNEDSSLIIKTKFIEYEYIEDAKY